jgi:hypothetical protein
MTIKKSTHFQKVWREYTKKAGLGTAYFCFDVKKVSKRNASLSLIIVVGFSWKLIATIIVCHSLILGFSGENKKNGLPSGRPSDYSQVNPD